MYKTQKGGTGRSYSKSQHSFAVAQPTVSRERSTIDRPSRTITAIDADYIYPVLVDEVLPGDTFQLTAQVKAWLATPLRPFLDNLYLNTFFFFVPNRLVWENWAKFQGAQDNPGDSISFVVPQISVAGGSAAGANKLADYMGIPTVATTKEVNAMPFRAYNLIYNEFFRDQNLQNSVTNDITDSDSTEANHVLLKRGKRKDYITGCLPWPQKGDAVELNLGTSAPLTLDAQQILIDPTTGGSPTFDGASVGSGLELFGGGDAEADWTGTMTGAVTWNTPDLEVELDGATGVVDLTTATASTVNQLRQSIAIQQLLELDARGGTRHIEQIKARFGVTSSDHRLQRPEYLGGSTVNVAVSPVPYTTFNSGSDIYAGNLGGFGTAQGGAGGFTHSFQEHGYVIGLVNLRSDLSYFEGLPRHWSRLTRYDYYEPALAHLGEQPVYNQEVYVSNTDADDFGPLGVWGYQERFAEYKYGNSMITSIMRGNHATNIDEWHLAEIFGSQPALNAAFITSSTPLDRVIAVSSEPHMLMDMYFTNRCTRVMPVFNTPGLSRL